MPATVSSETVPIVEMTELSVASWDNPGRPSVEGVNWTIRHHEWWIVGALAGGGKSGMLATAAGLMRPLKGRQWLLGREVGAYDGDALAEVRLRIGMLFSEGGRVFRHLTVAENLALPLCYHRGCTEQDAADEVAAMLEVTGLGYMARVPANRLNPSWRLRTALARALILRPEALFLDNPLHGLDPRQQKWWLDFLVELAAGHPFFQGRPLTLVVATDDFRPWLKSGRQFALLKQNQWITLGAYAENQGFDDPLWNELAAEPTGIR
jgi:ABC-type transporter Mla maintaining outer membrane lipid asymmetry ATPase subunit MlaF